MGPALLITVVILFLIAGGTGAMVMRRLWRAKVDSLQEQLDKMVRQRADDIIALAMKSADAKHASSEIRELSNEVARLRSATLVVPAQILSVPLLAPTAAQVASMSPRQVSEVSEGALMMAVENLKRLAEKEGYLLWSDHRVVDEGGRFSVQAAGIPRFAAPPGESVEFIGRQVMIDAEGNRIEGGIGPVLQFGPFPY